MSVTFSSIISGGSLFAQACLSHSAASYLGVHCLLRHVCHIQQHLIWGFTVCSGMSVTFSSILSGGSLFAQACLSHSAASYLGVHCLLRHVCHIQQHLIWGFAVCSGMSVRIFNINKQGSIVQLVAWLHISGLQVRIQAQSHNFHGDWSWNNFFSQSPFFCWFNKCSCQLLMKVCKQSTG